MMQYKPAFILRSITSFKYVFVLSWREYVGLISEMAT